MKMQYVFQSESGYMYGIENLKTLIWFCLVLDEKNAPEYEMFNDDEKWCIAILESTGDKLVTDDVQMDQLINCHFEWMIKNEHIQQIIK